MKRLIALFLSIVMTLSMLTGCSSKGNFQFEEDKVANAETAVEITRGQWIKMLAENYGITDCADDTQIFSDVSKSSPYFNYVQACYEWEMLEQEDEFKPDEIATVDFAIVTGVKSIGLDKIANSVGGKELTDDESIIKYYGSKAVAGSGNLTAAMAEDILANLDTINTSLKFEQYQDVEYQPGVINAEANNLTFSADGVTATLKNIDANVGDIIVVEPCVEAPYGYYVKITEKDGNNIKYVQPEFQELFDHVVIKGTYEPEVMAIIPAAENITLETTDGKELKPQAFFNPATGDTQTMYSLANMNYTGDLADGYKNTKTISLEDIKFKIGPKKTILGGESGGSNASINVFGDITLKNVKVNIDIDAWGNFIVTAADVSIESTLQFKGGVNGELSQTIPLAVIPLSAAGVATINFSASLKIGVEGEVSLEFSVDTKEGVEYKALKLPKIYKKISNPKLELVLSAKGYIRPQIVADFLVGPFSAINFKVYSGVEAKAETKIGKEAGVLRCADIYAYVPLVIGIDPEKTSALGKLGASASWSIWGPKDSPLRKTFHVEEFQIVPECTYKEEEEAEADASVIADMINDVFDRMEEIIDTALLEYSASGDNGLSISAFTVSMNVGAKDKIGILSIPSGYTMADIVITSSNPECVQVDGEGNITAVSEGMATIWVSTSDGQYSAACSVISWGSLAVDFTPLDDMPALKWEVA